MLSALLLTVTLAAPFGDAEARAVDAGPPLVVEVRVEVDGPFEAVLLRGISQTGELEPIAMTPQEDGSYATIVRLTQREDIDVAFEAIRESGEIVISDALSLTALGVDLAIFQLAPPTTGNPAPAQPDSATMWLVIAVVAVLGALLLVTMWVTDRSDESTEVDNGSVDNWSGNADNTVDPDHAGSETPT